jgi:hypothetical protein
MTAPSQLASQWRLVYHSGKVTLPYSSLASSICICCIGPLKYNIPLDGYGELAGSEVDVHRSGKFRGLDYSLDFDCNK